MELPTPAGSVVSTDPPDSASVPEQPHPWVEDYLRWRLTEGPPLDRAIHPADEMLEFLIGDQEGDYDAGLAAYFVSGLEAAETVERLAAARFGAVSGVRRLLDFGCGFGRVDRFLVRSFGADRLWVSDVVETAVEFQRHRFGVHGFRSAERPEALSPPRDVGDGFDLVFVCSLFTHLPPRTFAAWFDRLSALLSPQGVLAFTVHGEELVPPRHEMPPDGILFDASSESRSLDHAEYGSTWVTEEYVRRVVATPRAASDGPWQVRRLPRGLCGYQDLYLVARRNTAPLAGLELDPGPEGRVETCDTRRPGELVVAGWVVDRGEHAGAAIEQVAIILDGAVLATTRELGPRPDIAAALGSPRFERCGFRLQAPLPVPMRRSSAVVMVEARSRSGARRALYQGGLERLLHRTAHDNFVWYKEEFVKNRQRVWELAEVIAEMKQSRFWRLRRRWLSLKRRLRLAAEDPDSPNVEATDRQPSAPATPPRARVGSAAQERDR